MAIAKNILLWSSKNPWLLTNVPKYGFVQKAVKRFLPGEAVEDAIAAAAKLTNDGISSVLTQLGENVNDLPEAKKIADHFIDVLQKIEDNKLDAVVSLKLTQIGLDLSFEDALVNFKSIVKKAAELNNDVWIDMEEHSYTDTTIKFYREVKKDFSNVGICLQAYLYRTEKDIADLLPIAPNIRLVKGAYREPDNIAIPKKSDVDENYLKLTKTLLKEAKDSSIQVILGTHDVGLLKKVEAIANEIDLPQEKIAVQMLYGIMNEDLRCIGKDGYKAGILISYGSAWFPWYIRRLAERPANVWFVLKNILKG
jgi:proline dehydrogenase